MSTTNKSNTSFDPPNWLGLSYNILEDGARVPVSVNDFVNTRMLKFNNPAVMMDPQTSLHTFARTGAVWDTPKNVRILDRENLTSMETRIFSSGTELVNSMSAGASITAGYAGVSVKGGFNYDASESFDSSMMYAFVTKTVTAYVASLVTTPTTINPALLIDIEALPDFDKSIPTVVQQYRDFWDTWGTHFIDKVNYGWFYQNEVSQSTATSGSTTKFSANVEASYLTNSGSVEGGTSDSFKTFQSEKHKKVETIGGNAGGIAADPESSSVISGWLSQAGSTGSYDEGLFGIETSPLPRLLKDLGDKKYRAKYAQLTKALFVQGNCCKRRISVMFPLFTDSSNMTTGLQFWVMTVRIKSSNVRIAPSMKPTGDGKILNMTQTRNVGGPDFNYYDNNIMNDGLGGQVGIYFDVITNDIPNLTFSFECPEEERNAYRYDYPGRYQSAETTAEYGIIVDQYESPDGNIVESTPRREVFSIRPTWTTGVVTPEQEVTVDLVPDAGEVW